MTDTTPPQLHSLTIPSTIDLSSGAKTITFAASASDDSSGIHWVYIYFDKSFASQGSYFIMFGASDSWADGSSTQAETIPVNTANGTYTVSHVDVYDNAGNSTIYTTAQLNQMGFGTTITVSGSDTAGPQLTNISFDRTIDLSAGSAAFHFSASATDRSGIYDAIFHFDGALSTHYIFGSTNDSWADGTSATSDTISASTSPGTYNLLDVQLFDSAGNSSTYTAAQLQQMGFATTVTIAGSDKSGPTLTGLTFDQNIDLSAGPATFHFAASATDRSGIYSAVINFDNGVGSHYIFGTTADSWADGSSSSTDSIPVSTPAGVYNVLSVQVTDTLGNTSTYTPAQLAQMGFQTSVTVGASDTTGPTLTNFTHAATVDISAGASTVTFGVSATDRSGISQAIVHLDKGLFGNSDSTALIFGTAADTWDDGASTDTETVPVTTPPGVYTVSDLQVTDKAGNTTTYTKAQLTALGFSTTITVTGADTTAPQLTSLTFPTTVDISSAAKQVTFAAAATDNATGIRDVTIHFDKDFSGSTGHGTLDLNGTVDSWTDGASSLTQTFQTTTPPGVYTITDVVVTDGAGNTKTYTTTQLQGLGIATSLTVTGDSTKPQLTGLTFPTTVDVSNGSRVEPFSATATDNATGISDVRIHFDKDLLTGLTGGLVDLNGTGDSWADGASVLNLTIPNTARTGTYNITSVEVIDGAGNVATYTPAQLTALGIATSLSITGGVPPTGDTTPPNLTSLTFPTTIDVSTGAKSANFQAAGTDDASGIRDVAIHFDKDLLGGAGVGLVDIAGTAGDPWADGASSFLEVIPTTAKSGVYTITSVDITDNSGNVASYTAAQLAALHISTSISITGGQTTGPDTTGPVPSSFTIPVVVDITHGLGPFSFSAPSTDQTGVQGGVLWLDHQISIDNGSGVSTTSGFAFGPGGVSGSNFANWIDWPIYEIQSIDYTDTLNHTSTYTTAQLATFGFRTGFFVLDASYGVTANNVIGGTYGNDVLHGTSAINVIFGLEGNDSLFSEGGPDWLYGGRGDDTYYIVNGGERIFERTDEGSDRVYTSVSYTLASNQSIEFLSVRDVTTTIAIDLTGNEIANTITGNAGANKLDGKGGIDQMHGMGGNDIYYVDNSGDRVFESINGGSDTVLTSVNYVLSINQEIEFLATTLATSTIAINLTGNEFANTITGNAGVNRLDGKGGADNLYGLGGNDIYYIDNSGDRIFESINGGSDTVLTSVNYVLSINQEIEFLSTWLITSTIAINLTGNEFANTITGNAGANRLDGKGGIDQLHGLGGNDIYIVDNSGDRVFESINGGSDTVLTSVNYVLSINQEIEFLATTLATSTVSINLTGNEFANRITGNAGANTIDGKGGIDLMYGLGGNDLYYIDNSGDRVFESSNGGNDRVYTSVSYTLAIGQEIETLVTTLATATVAINLTGNEFANTIVANAGANRIDGKGGIDLMYGLGGNDLYYVDNSGDRVFESVHGGNDRVYTAVSYTLAIGQEIETLVTTLATATVAINLIGNEFAQTIVGNAGANTINGKGGIDLMYGLSGNDICYVDNSADRVFESINSGNDRVYTSVSYTLAIGQEIETFVTTLSTATVAINLIGNEFAQTIVGNAGANRIDGKGGIDLMYGLGGNDIYYVDNSADRVFESVGGGNDRVYTSVSYALAVGQEIETFVTTLSTATVAINLTGNEFAQTIVGNAGMNTIDGKGGIDLMYGLGGNDIYYVDNSADRVFESVGGGNDRVYTSVSYTLAVGQEIETFSTTLSTSTVAINLTGNELANTITGNAGMNTIDGKGGIDLMSGLGGNDIYYVDNAADRVFESINGGNDHVYASVSYTLGAWQEIETLSTTLATATTAINLTGNEFSNTIIGNAGTNTLRGGGGTAADVLSGLGGGDFYYVNHAGDSISEAVGGGTDRVLAHVSYTLNAGAEVEVMSTDNNAATIAIDLTGNEFGQTIYGNAGPNTINGGGGNDILIGLGGNDRFLFNTALNASTNVDLISSFTVSTGTAGDVDKILLDDAIFAALNPSHAATPFTLSATAFTIATPVTADQHIIYSATNGALLYDDDGFGAHTAVQFATLSPHAILTNADFLVV